MASIIRFVNAIVDTPTTVLDLNASPIMVSADGIDLSPPDVRRSKVETFLGVDGDVVTDTAPENRTITLPLTIVGNVTAEQVADAVTDLHAQLVKPRNILMIQLDGMSKPVFFRTYAAHDYTLKMLRLLLHGSMTSLELEIPAEPYGYGPKVTLAQRTMYNSLFAGPTASINGGFETDVSGWEVDSGSGASTFTRVTSQFHAGAASGMLNPSGSNATVRARLSANVTASEGQQWQARAWLRNEVARTISLEIGFFNGSTLIGSWTARAISVAADTWRFFAISATAPASTTGVRMATSMTGTPPSSDDTYIDEAVLTQHHVDGSVFTDMTGILGDTDTPMFLKIADNLGTAGTGQRMSLLAMRKGGTPSNVPFLIEAETFTRDTDTLLDEGNNAATASNGAYLNTTFSTTTAMARRMHTTAWPTSWSTDLRGRYDVYARIRGNNASTVIKLQLGWGNSSTSLYKGDIITLPNTPTLVWFYLWLGTISFPSGFDPVTEGYSNSTIDAAQLYVELAMQRVSGTGGTDLDTFSFFPADDQSCLIKWPPQTNCTNYIIDGRATSVYGLDASSRAAAIDAIAVAGAVPMLRPGVTNRLFFARDVGYGTGSTQALGAGDDNLATTTVTPFYWPRYYNFRQAAT